jgi:hypothetical protein
MSEQPDEDTFEETVDDVDAPVDEHVAAFEQAHDQLRRALSDAGDDAP